ncbi:hypothetical protein OG21DRAFT_1142240 [Imleria badia]|nr:hypothetical protein OG21DRAFT_1142240 [Imleria badia]
MTWVGRCSDVSNALATSPTSIRRFPCLSNPSRMTSDGHPYKPRRLTSYTLCSFRPPRRCRRHPTVHLVARRFHGLHLRERSQKASVPGQTQPFVGRTLELLGDIKDIDRAVALFEDVTRLTPKDHPESRAQVQWILDLSTCLWRRFYRLGDLANLKKAVAATENVLAHTPQGPSRRGCVAQHSR